jgi:hypothetical protein
MAEPTHEELVERAVETFADDPFVRDLVILFDAEFDSVEVDDENDASRDPRRT